MILIEAIVLGLVQGLGEFLPISSSAHLVLTPWLFNWTDPGLTFDIALHFGTLVAVVIYFWSDWIKLIKAGLTGARNLEGRLFWYLVVGSVPGAAVGLLLEKQAETVFRAPLLIAGMLIAMGLVLYWADYTGAKQKEIKDMGLGTVLTIGLSQALSIIPGVSRSGITMSTGLFLGIKREDTARFSFLLSAPIILGAAAAKLPDLMGHSAEIDLSFIMGVLVSAVVGAVSIHFLLRYVQYRDFRLFVWYRMALGLLVIAVALVRG